MAIVQNPYIGRSRGKIANIVMYSTLGKNVIRSKPLEVHNPRTIPQQVARRTFSTLSKMAKKLNSVIEVGLGTAAVGMYPRNMFIMQSKEAITVDNNLAVTFVPAEVVLSLGSLGNAPTMGTVTDNNGGDITINFSTPGETFTSAEKVAVAVIDGNGVVLGNVVNAGNLNGGSVDINVSGAGAGDYVFIFGYNPTTGAVTDTSFKIIS